VSLQAYLGVSCGKNRHRKVVAGGERFDNARKPHNYTVVAAAQDNAASAKE
jgi:hypothetical protein